MPAGAVIAEARRRYRCLGFLGLGLGLGAWLASGRTPGVGPALPLPTAGAAMAAANAAAAVVSQARRELWFVLFNMMRPFECQASLERGSKHGSGGRARPPEWAQISEGLEFLKGHECVVARVAANDKWTDSRATTRGAPAAVRPAVAYAVSCSAKASARCAPPHTFHAALYFQQGLKS